MDANLLLYAYHPRAEQHDGSRVWLQTVLSECDLVCFAWLTLWAFLRIATNPRIFDRPLSTSEAVAAISSWLAFTRESRNCSQLIRITFASQNRLDDGLTGHSAYIA